MRNLLSCLKVVLVSVLFVSGAYAQSSGRPTGIRVGQQIGDRSISIQVQEIQTCRASSKNFDPKAISCTSRQAVENILEITSIATEAVAAACGAIPGSATVFAGVAVAGVTLHTLKFIVENMECENPANERQIEALINRKVCEGLIRNGLSCNARIF